MNSVAKTPDIASPTGMPDPAAVPLALYLHFPWCVSKCPYCDFNSFALGRTQGGLETTLPEQRYVEALLDDLDAQVVRFEPTRRLTSVFLGGGTPSLFTPAAVARVLEHVRQQFVLADDVEITMEANPGTLERGAFRAYRDAGINRVSLGVQSFDNAQLKALGRVHSADEARRAAAELHAADLPNFNLDLMYGLPGQSLAAARADIEAALALEPAHLSHYQLTLEPGTPLAAAPPPLPDDERTVAMLAECKSLLADAGFARYEVSAYARAGRASRHNLNYWNFGDYIGAGAGAHGKLTRASGIERTQQTREPRRYMAGARDALAVRAVPAAQLPFEFMLNALRLLAGFQIEQFEGRTGLAWSTVASQWELGQRTGLLETTASGWHRPTQRGIDFLNDALLCFLPDQPRQPVSPPN